MTNRFLYSVFHTFLALAWLAACRPPSESPARPSPTEKNDLLSKGVIILPTPVQRGSISLEEALARRRSVRDYTQESLTEAEIGQLLWAAQGITHPAGYRTTPSAGALYPLEVYVVTTEGVFHYAPGEHSLRMHRKGNIQTELYKAAIQQQAVLEAPVVFVIAAVYERTEKKYGKERSPRYVHLEAGHAAQNLLLQATALDLGSVPIGAFLDDEVKAVLNLPADQQPLYLIPVGHPASAPEESR